MPFNFNVIKGSEQPEEGLIQAQVSWYDTFKLFCSYSTVKPTSDCQSEGKAPEMVLFYYILHRYSLPRLFSGAPRQAEKKL
jgi:hypothetical protein